VVAVLVLPLVVAALLVPMSLAIVSLVRFDLHAARDAANMTANNILLRGLFMIAPYQVDCRMHMRTIPAKQHRFKTCFEVDQKCARFFG
jgi:hypothetical protein